MKPGLGPSPLAGLTLTALGGFHPTIEAFGEPLDTIVQVVSSDDSVAGYLLQP